MTHADPPSSETTTQRTAEGDRLWELLCSFARDGVAHQEAGDYERAVISYSLAADHATQGMAFYANLEVMREPFEREEMKWRHQVNQLRALLAVREAQAVVAGLIESPAVGTEVFQTEKAAPAAVGHVA